MKTLTTITATLLLMCSSCKEEYTPPTQEWYENKVINCISDIAFEQISLKLGDGANWSSIYGEYVMNVEYYNTIE